MQAPLGLLHTLGYGGAPLHYAGDGCAVFACGTMVRKVSGVGGNGGQFASEGLGVGTMCVHPSQQSYAYCEKGRGAVVRVCDMTSGRVQEKIDGAGSIDVDVMSFTADGSALVTVAGLPDFQVTIWDWTKQTELVTGVAPQRLRSGGFNPQNPDQLIFLGDGALYVCNVVAGASGPEFEFDRISGPSEEVAFSSFTWMVSGKLYVTTTDGCLWMVDPSAGALVGEATVVSADKVQTHVIATYAHLVCWCSDGVIAWLGMESLSEGYRVKVPLPRHETLVSLCMGDAMAFAGASEGSVFHIDLLQDIPDGTYRDEEEEPSPVTIKDADILAGEVQYDSHHRLTRIALSHCGPVNGLAPVPSLSCFASVGSDGLLCLWDSSSGALVAAQRCGRPLRALAGHPEEPLVCIADDKGMLNVLDVAMPARIKVKFSAKLFAGPLSALAFNPDGGILAAASPSSDHVYFLSVQSGTVKVIGFSAVPVPGVTCLAWRARTSVLACGEHRHVFEVCNVPLSKPEAEGLDLALGLTATAVHGVVRAMAVVEGGLACACEGDRAVRVYAAGDWQRVTDKASLQGVPEAAGASEFRDHDKRPNWLHATQDGKAMGCCSADGLVTLRAGAEMAVVYSKRCFSVWVGGATAVAAHAAGGATAVCAGSTLGAVMILCVGDAAALKGRPAAPATSIAKALVDHIGEPVELTLPRTFAESQLLEDLEMQNALNAAKKNETREKLRVLKAALDELLELNGAAPEIERIPREQIVLDRELRDTIIQEGNERVVHTQTMIRKENMVKDMMAKRVKELAWDSMQVHGTELLSFTTGQVCNNFPIRVASQEEIRTLEKVRMMRRIEIGMQKAMKKELSESNSVVDLAIADTAAGGEAAQQVAQAAQEGELQHETLLEDVDEVWRQHQEDPCMYHRFEVSCRERKTSQIVMLEECIRKAKMRFNAMFDDFMKRKIAVLGKIEEKNARISEIQEELSSSEMLFDASLHDSEQPERVLMVEDEDVKVEKWVSQEERRRKEQEEQSKKKKGEGEDAADRALKQMMGGNLAGESKVNKLSQELAKPAHLIPAEGEELTEDQMKELKEWEAVAKVLAAEQELYRKALEGEAKKLRAEIQEECKKFDDGMQELMDARLHTDYTVYEQELYKIKLIQAVAQEEDDIAATHALKGSIQDMLGRQSVAARAVEEFSEEVADAERTLEGLRAESQNLEKGFKRELVDHASATVRDIAELLLRTYKRRGGLEDVPPGLGDDVMARAEELLDEAQAHDQQVLEQQGTYESVRSELDRLQWTLQQIEDSIRAAEEELQQLEARMLTAGSDLDITFMIKQGQVEVEQSAVATDFSDAEIVEKEVIHADNKLITTRGKEKVSILYEIKDFRKGIHVLLWDNQRLDLEEEELLQRTKDLQLLRVTKGLQSIIKGSDQDKTAHENASLEKLLTYQTNMHQQRVKEKAKSVEVMKAQSRTTARENKELDEDIFALESAVVERQRLCELQGAAAQQGEGRANKSEVSKMRMMITHRKLLDLARAQTREIELMREELVRLRARTFPSFAQLSEQSSLPDSY